MIIYEDDSESTKLAHVEQPGDFTGAVTSSGPTMYITWYTETFSPLKDYFRVSIPYMNCCEKIELVKVFSTFSIKQFFSNIIIFLAPHYLALFTLICDHKYFFIGWFPFLFLKIKVTEVNQ